jgi:hypothetical protein
MNRRRALLWLSVFIALALVTWARVALLDSLRDHGFFGKYLTFADAILAGNVPRHRIGDVSPGYLWLMVGLRAIGLAFEPIRNLQLVMITAGALFCALAAKRHGGWVAAISAAILILGNRAALIIGAELEPEALIFVLNAAAMLAVVRRKWWLAGLLVGLSAATRPTAMLTLILIGGWVLLQSRRAIFAYAAAALAPIAIVVGVNAAITGHTFIMQPGSGFFEANNPLATGCAGVYPRIVEDIQSSSREPDYGHVVYRIIAARATGQPLDAKLSNRFWSRKALAFIWSYPVRSMELFGWKAILAVHHYDIYDLFTTKRKSLELARFPAIPFGVAFVLALVALLFGRDRRELLPIIAFAVSTLVALIVFNVSARQRNALLAPLAILGGLGVAEIVALARARDERCLYAFAGVMIATPLLGIEGTPMKEDQYNWWAQLRATSMRAEAYRTRNVDLAAASILDLVRPPLVDRGTLIRAALATATQVQSPQRLFDVAIALQKAGAWRESEAVLATIDDYQPRRENRAVSSVAYYRARAAIHMRAPKTTVDNLLEVAQREAPGDPHILALLAVTSRPDSRELLDKLYDPFTRDHALAAALTDLGDTRTANALIARLRRVMPEWSAGVPPAGSAASRR